MWQYVCNEDSIIYKIQRKVRKRDVGSLKAFFPPSSPPTLLLLRIIITAMARRAVQQKTTTEKPRDPASTLNGSPLAAFAIAAIDQATPRPRKTFTELLPVTLPMEESAYSSPMAATLLAKVSVELTMKITIMMSVQLRHTYGKRLNSLIKSSRILNLFTWRKKDQPCFDYKCVNFRNKPLLIIIISSGLFLKLHYLVKMFIQCFLFFTCYFIHLFFSQGNL